jgi:hypothetical protein
MFFVSILLNFILNTSSALSTYNPYHSPGKKKKKRHTPTLPTTQEAEVRRVTESQLEVRLGKKFTKRHVNKTSWTRLWCTPEIPAIEGCR